MRRFGAVIVLIVALLTLFPRPSDAQGSWLDNAPGEWNAPGALVPAAPAAPGSDDERCARLVRPPETNEDAAVTAQGWQLLPSYERGSDITLVGAGVGFDAMCRPVYFQQFVFVDGLFAGTLSPQPMVPRSDGALTDARISSADHVDATYLRFAPTDPLCCPSGETRVSFAIAQTPAGPIVTPGDGQRLATPAVAIGTAISAAVTPVCVILGTGGDDLSLVSWREDEIATYEATGEPSAPPDPATGTCLDLAGRPVISEFLGGFSWVCLQTATGDWYGPQWTARIYLPKNAVPPDPTQGGCPEPRDGSIPQRPDAEQAASTAVYLSQLEASSDLDTLYDWLHPDAQTEIPKDVVTGWYGTDWLPRGPQPINVTGVNFGDWTWDVTGRIYPNTAEIAYEQPLADGSTVRDVLRLVQDDQGLWRWFFGRDRAFVDEEIARFAPDSSGG